MILEKLDYLVECITQDIISYLVEDDKISVKKAMDRVRIKYGIYRDNGYSPLYFFECFMVEAAKLIVG